MFVLLTKDLCFVLIIIVRPWIVPSAYIAGRRVCTCIDLAVFLMV